MIDFQHPKAYFIGPDAEVETLQTYEERLDYYREQDFSYIPLPVSKQYYDVEEEEIRPLSRKQFLNEDHSIMKAWYGLSEYPFLLIEKPMKPSYWVSSGEFGYGNPRGDDVSYYSHPWVIPHYCPDADPEDLLQYESNRYQILTLADLNRRKSKEILYSVVAAVENVFSSRVEDYYETEDLLPRVGAETIGRWYKARTEGVNMHIAEFMSTGKLKQVIRTTSDLYEDLGFDSATKFSDHFSGFIDLRNRVMHTNRTVVRNREELTTQLERIERLYQFLCSEPVDLRTDYAPIELAKAAGAEKDKRSLGPIYLDGYETGHGSYDDSSDEGLLEWVES